MTYLIGQRVIVGNAICYVIEPDVNGRYSNPLRPGIVEYVTPGLLGEIWIYVPHLGYASHYDSRNVKPLPGGQL